MDARQEHSGMTKGCAITSTYLTTTLPQLTGMPACINLSSTVVIPTSMPFIRQPSLTILKSYCRGSATRLSELSTIRLSSLPPDTTSRKRLYSGLSPARTGLAVVGTEVILISTITTPSLGRIVGKPDFCRSLSGAARGQKRPEEIHIPLSFEGDNAAEHLSTETE